jgi:tetratricopeptide (TPR) repeat protein
LKENANTGKQSSVTMAISSSNLANVLRKMDRLADAEQLYNQAITFFRKFDAELTLKSGRNNADEDEDASHKDVTNVQIAICLNNLGRLFQKKGDHATAEGLFRQALAIDEIHYSPGHIDINIDLHNLGISLLRLGRKEEAMECGKKALEIYTRVYGKDDKLTEPVALRWAPLLERASRRIQQAQQEQLRQDAVNHRTEALPSGVSDKKSDADEE